MKIFCHECYHSFTFNPFSLITQMEDGHYNINVDILLLLICTSKTSKVSAETQFVSKRLLIYANHS